MILKFKLIPQKSFYKDKPYYEQILVCEYDTTYPIALLHIDTFYDKYNTKIHDLLNQGETVIVSTDWNVVEE